MIDGKTHTKTVSETYFSFEEYRNKLTLYDDDTSEPLAQVDCGSGYLNRGGYATQMETLVWLKWSNSKEQDFTTFQCGSCEKVFYSAGGEEVDCCGFCGSGNFLEGYIDDEN
jgi:hypothetical protein